MDIFQIWIIFLYAHFSDLDYLPLWTFFRSGLSFFMHIFSSGLFSFMHIFQIWIIFLHAHFSDLDYLPSCTFSDLDYLPLCPFFRSGLSSFHAHLNGLILQLCKVSSVYVSWLRRNKEKCGDGQTEWFLYTSQKLFAWVLLIFYQLLCL